MCGTKMNFILSRAPHFVHALFVVFITTFVWGTQRELQETKDG